MSSGKQPSIDADLRAISVEELQAKKENCQRVVDEIKPFGFERLYLPTWDDKPHWQKRSLPVLVKNHHGLSGMKHIIFVVPSYDVPCGIFNPEDAERENMWEAETMVGLARQLDDHRSGVVAVVVLNPGELLVLNPEDYADSEALTTGLSKVEWDDYWQNTRTPELIHKIEGHRGPQQHLDNVFRQVADKISFIHHKVTFSIIAHGDKGAKLVLKWLKDYESFSIPGFTGPIQGLRGIYTYLKTIAWVNTDLSKEVFEEVQYMSRKDWICSATMAFDVSDDVEAGTVEERPDCWVQAKISKAQLEAEPAKPELWAQVRKFIFDSDSGHQ